MRATYRLQLRAEFGFDDARAEVGYLSALGVSHLYLSPIMQARPGSSHGYDVVDPTRVSDELGGEPAFRRLAAAAHGAGMGLIVDFVPNHMAVGDLNPYWRDPDRRRRVFDVDRATGWRRRFFTIDELAGVRVEDPEVFEETHRTVLALVADGSIDGLRIDHIDGLADPAGYLHRLRERGVEHVWVEKILQPGEALRDWPVDGTTGYEFANDTTALLVDPAGEPALTAAYTGFTGDRETFAEIREAAKREQVLLEFAPEIAKLRSLLDVPELEEALAAVPVYRSYVEPRSGAIDAADRTVLATLPARVRRVMTLAQRGHDDFVERFQQTTPAVMAKGVEDTAFYRYARLLALNEVGGDPGRLSIPVAEFHRACAERAARLPRQLLATQTHDTKRSGDVRARIGALAGLAEEWAGLVARWHASTAALRDGPGPDRLEEYMIYQTLVGAWPIEPERLAAYLEKALREAGRHTSWRSPDAAWERSVREFADGLYGHRPFREAFDPFAAKVATAGERAALVALALALTSPGVPDIYQGDELCSLNLVDPDNRRPVAWQPRHERLARLAAGEPPGEGDRKLHLILQTLALRARRAESFAGGYEPLPAPAGVCAYLRGADVAVVAGVRPGADVDAVAPPGEGWRELLGELAAFAPLRLLERG